MYLPVCEKAPAPAQPEQLPSRQRQPAAAVVLVVDDEEMVRRLARMALERRGYGVLEAGTGREALRVLAGADPPPALVLLDLAMPEMGGDELIPILAERYSNLKIVVSSGYSEEEVRKTYQSNLVAGFLQKPYTVADLSDKMDEVMPGRPMNGGNLIEFPRAG